MQGFRESYSPHKKNTPSPPHGPSLSLLLYLAFFITLTTITISATIEQNAKNHLDSIQAAAGILAKHFSTPDVWGRGPAAIQRDVMALSEQSKNIAAIDILALSPARELEIVASSSPATIGRPAGQPQLKAFQSGTPALGHCSKHSAPTICNHLPMRDADGDVFAVLTFSTIANDGSNAVWLYTGVTTLLFMLVAIMLYKQQHRTRRELLARRKTEKELILREAQLSQIIDLVPHLIFAKDKDSRYILANSAVAKLYGLTPQELIGKKQTELQHEAPEQTVRFVMDDRRVITTGRPRLGYEENICDIGGHKRIYETSKIPFTTAGHPAVLGVGIDITERKRLEKELREHRDKLESLVNKRTRALIDANMNLTNEITEREAAQNCLEDSLAEKEMLLQEIHHRVMNNLQVISGLLDMARRRAQNPELIDLTEDLSTKIHSISLVHTQLYRSKRFDRIDFAAYTLELCKHLQIVFGAAHIHVEYDLTPVDLPISTASPCGMVANELISNVFKHAFPDKETPGRLRLTLRHEDNGVTFIIEDNGVGLPEDFNPDASSRLGMKLITNIVRFQLRGTVDFSNENGSLVTIRFPFFADFAHSTASKQTADSTA